MLMRLKKALGAVMSALPYKSRSPEFRQLRINAGKTWNT
jgi:hypothetical protein